MESEMFDLEHLPTFFFVLWDYKCVVSIFVPSQPSALDITSSVTLCPLKLSDYAIFNCRNPLFYKFSGWIKIYENTICIHLVLVVS